jgi:DNA-binding transcriptional ArsR family regulator
VEISDPKAIRALAHPLRLDLLDLLVATGPATAAQCGRILGVSQASCSFHLRQLAKYGFVVDAGPGSDRRERQWRMPDPRLRLPGGDAVTRQLQRVVVERAMHEILDYGARADGDDPGARGFGGPIGGVAVVSAAEATEIRAKWKELLAPYLARTAGSGLRLQPGQRYVRYFMAGTPLPDLDPPGTYGPDTKPRDTKPRDTEPRDTEPKDNVNDAHD